LFKIQDLFININHHISATAELISMKFSAIMHIGPLNVTGCLNFKF